MGEEQGLSAENRALIETALDVYARAMWNANRHISGNDMNRLLDAARSEGLQPVSVMGEDVQIRGGSGAQERPSRRAPTDCQTSGGAK